MKGKILSFFFVVFCCYPLVLPAQTRQVTGTVRNSAGEPVVNATVSQKGSNNSTVAGEDGRFTLTVTGVNVILTLSAVNYQNTEINAGTQSAFEVTLLESTGTKMDEVFVVAYGTAKKSTYTGAATVINASKIKDVPTTSFENALNGRVAGLQITQTSGQAGSAPALRIRGIGSMNASNDPLYVLDGVPIVSESVGQMGSYLNTTNNIMANINPDDIESITVLKDAAASSLYGSRAANGVVIINTKKGKIGAPVISFKTSLGITPTWATDNYEAAGVQEQINMLYQVFYDLNITGGKTPEAANTDALSRLNSRFNRHGYRFETSGTDRYQNVAILGMTDGIENREGRYFNWDDVLFRTGFFTTNDLSVSGGTDKTKYYSSLSYTQDKSRVAVNEFQRIAGRLNLTQKIGSRLELESNIGISKNDKSGFNDSRSTGSNYMLQSRNLLWPVYWPTDYKTGLPFTARFGSLAQNNVYYDNEWDNTAGTLNISAVEALTVNILSGLTAKSIFSYNNSQIKEHLYYSALHFSGVAPVNGQVHELSTNINKMVSSTTLNYNKAIHQHSIGVLAGYEAEKNLTDFMRSSGNNLPSSSLPTVVTAGTTNASAYNWGYNMQSFLSRAEYNFSEKYFFSASYRRDGNSRFGPVNRWANFWSVGGAWNIFKEDFLKENELLNELRIRGSYGTNATTPSANYGWRTLLSFTDKYMEQPGGSIVSIADSGLAWETNYNTNLAIEFGLLERRVTGSIEYFNRDSRNLLMDVPISMVTGLPSTLKNVGEINNRGIEWNLGVDIVRKEHLKWSVGLNGTIMNSKVTKLNRQEGASVGQDIIWNDPTGNDARAQFIYREGQSMLAFYGFEWAGVDPTNGKNVWYINDPNSPTTGDFEFNGRGATYTYSKANRIIIGNGTPKMFGGFTSDLEYKGISLNLNFIYKLGGDLYDGAYKDVADDGYYWERIRSQDYYDNMWTDNNTSGTLPKLSGNDLTDPMQYSTRQLHDASFLRLKNATLAYRLPGNLLGGIGVRNARVFVNGTNLFTAAKYKLADPEVNQFATRGWEIPFAKTYTFGIEVSF
ncbi:SusC/RagA family TonB-linked outer membrane protein [Niabella yanshanensis]|uniref:SusC/RagA family TonB-linked outer membrane protein n=1 Tax=Niabella yanshanensis TaxID=577386 RepID=A0ABZ0W005_9BACT|nr:SusC/RagA family TonB-linked outer membrane protein [Niabella yanshanensis]WQD36516.1 SusC/RagA family TonB-linked outer membrane protein [Niabella yanshanensis]